MSEFLSTLSEFGLGALGYLLLEASKYIISGSFSLKTFFKSNIYPFLYTLVGGVVVVAIANFLPQYIPFIETASGQAVDLSFSGLMLTGGFIGGIIKGYIEKAKAKDKASELPTSSTVSGSKGGGGKT